MSAPADRLIPAHQENCFGCGPDNPAGLGMQMRSHGDRVLCELVLDRRFEGAPGLAHGGAVAAAVDDLFGGVIVELRTPAVTAQLVVDYRAPVLLDTPLALTAWCHERQGRKLHLRATVHADGALVVEARAIFVVVELSHFHRAGRPLPGGFGAW